MSSERWFKFISRNLLPIFRKEYHLKSFFHDTQSIRFKAIVGKWNGDPVVGLQGDDGVYGRQRT